MDWTRPKKFMQGSNADVAVTVKQVTKLLIAILNYQAVVTLTDFLITV